MENSTKLLINMVLCLNVTPLTKQNFHHRYNSFIDCSGKSSGLLPFKSLRNSHHIPSPHPISSCVQHLRYPPHFPMSISSSPSIWYQNHNLFLWLCQSRYCFFGFLLIQCHFFYFYLVSMLGREHYENFKFYQSSGDVFLDN